MTRSPALSHSCRLAMEQRVLWACVAALALAAGACQTGLPARPDKPLAADMVLEDALVPDRQRPVYLAEDGYWVAPALEGAHRGPDPLPGALMELVDESASGPPMARHLFAVVDTSPKGLLLQRLDHATPGPQSRGALRLVPPTRGVPAASAGEGAGLIACVGTEPAVSQNACVRAAGPGRRWDVYGRAPGPGLRLVQQSPSKASAGSMAVERAAQLWMGQADGVWIAEEAALEAGASWVAVAHPGHWPQPRVVRVGLEGACPAGVRASGLRDVDWIDLPLSPRAARHPLEVAERAGVAGVDAWLRCDAQGVALHTPSLLLRTGRTPSGEPLGPLAAGLEPLAVRGPGGGEDARQAALLAVAAARAGRGEEAVASWLLEQASRLGWTGERGAPREAFVALSALHAGAGQPERGIRLARAASARLWNPGLEPLFALSKASHLAALGRPWAASELRQTLMERAAALGDARLRGWLVWTELDLEAWRTGQPAHGRWSRAAQLLSGDRALDGQLWGLAMYAQSHDLLRAEGQEPAIAEVRALRAGLRDQGLGEGLESVGLVPADVPGEGLASRAMPGVAAIGLAWLRSEVVGFGKAGGVLEALTRAMAHGDARSAGWLWEALAEALASELHARGPALCVGAPTGVQALDGLLAEGAARAEHLRPVAALGHWRRVEAGRMAWLREVFLPALCPAGDGGAGTAARRAPGAAREAGPGGWAAPLWRLWLSRQSERAQGPAALLHVASLSAVPAAPGGPGARRSGESCGAWPVAAAHVAMQQADWAHAQHLLVQALNCPDAASYEVSRRWVEALLAYELSGGANRGGSQGHGPLARPFGEVLGLVEPPRTCAGLANGGLLPEAGLQAPVLELVAVATRGADREEPGAKAATSTRVTARQNLSEARAQYASALQALLQGSPLQARAHLEEALAYFRAVGQVAAQRRAALLLDLVGDAGLVCSGASSGRAAAKPPRGFGCAGESELRGYLEQDVAQADAEGLRRIVGASLVLESPEAMARRLMAAGPQGAKALQGFCTPPQGVTLSPTALDWPATGAAPEDRPVDAPGATDDVAPRAGAPD